MKRAKERCSSWWPGALIAIVAIVSVPSTQADDSLPSDFNAQIVAYLESVLGPYSHLIRESHADDHAGEPVICIEWRVRRPLLPDMTGRTCVYTDDPARVVTQVDAGPDSDPAPLPDWLAWLLYYRRT